jgi:hypothetical protein
MGGLANSRNLGMAALLRGSDGTFRSRGLPPYDRTRDAINPEFPSSLFPAPDSSHTAI